MGPRGCGISTAVTFALEAFATTAVLVWRPRPVGLRGASNDWVHVRHEGRAIARIAFPSLLERILYHSGYLGFVAIIALLGDAAMAANQALISIEAVCFLSGDGFGIAAAALVAQSLGRDDARASERFARRAAEYAVLMLTALGLLAFLLRRPLLQAFSSDPPSSPRGSARSRCSFWRSRSWPSASSSGSRCAAPAIPAARSA